MRHWFIDGIWIWEQGTCDVLGAISKEVNTVKARRNRITGHVQFILWKAGEQGYKKDFWYDLHESHWPFFKQTKDQAEAEYPPKYSKEEIENEFDYEDRNDMYDTNRIARGQREAHIKAVIQERLKAKEQVEVWEQTISHQNDIIRIHERTVEKLERELSEARERIIELVDRLKRLA